MARPGFSLDRKFKRLSRSLEVVFPGLGDVLARGALELLWDAAYEACDEYVGDAVDVEAQAQWKGASGVLVRELAAAGGEGKAGFIEEGGSEWWPEGRPGTFRIHDLWDHAPDYAKKRLGRELEREQAGTTIREQRAAAGRKGAARTNAGRADRQPPDAEPPSNGQQPDGKRPPFAGQAAAGDRQVAVTLTLAPTLAPAPKQQQPKPPEPDIEPARPLTIIDESGPWPETPPLWPLAMQFRDLVSAACGRTAPFPVGGGSDVWRSLEASLARTPPAEAAELCRQRDLDAVAKRQKRPGTLAYFARLLEDEGRAPARDIRVGRADPAPAAAFQEGEHELRM